MQAIIWNRLHELPAETRAAAKAWDAAADEHKYLIGQTARSFGVYLLLFGLLLLGAGAFVAYGLFVRKSPLPATGLHLAALFFFGLTGIASLVAWVQLVKRRLERRLYYVYLDKDRLVERRPGYLTVIPRARLAAAFHRKELGGKGRDVYFDTVTWRDDAGEEHNYDLHDHYLVPGIPAEKRTLGVVLEIQRRYRVGQPTGRRTSAAYVHAHR